jgi:FkbM family methyltransferase
MKIKMNIIKRVIVRLDYLYKVYILKDPFLLEIKRWFKDLGHNKFNLNYQLNQNSIIFDVGGYHGDFAEAAFQKFGCRVFVFEPIPAFYDACKTRFKDKPSIICLNYGLSSASGSFPITLNDDASSFKKESLNNSTYLAEVRSISEAIVELGVENIDLIKINIEGGEFDLLPAIIECGLVKQVKYIQVQFHNFVDGAVVNRERIRKSLEKTHREMWNYEFVWESWERI